MCPAFVFELGKDPPDVRLIIFDQEIHVHACVLRAHSSFFRAFLRSVHDRPISSSGTSAFLHEYGSKVDNDGTWGLQPLSTVTSDNGLRGKLDSKHRLDTSMETKAFSCLLDAFYNRPVELGDLQLEQIVNLADFYGALPALSTAFPRILSVSSPLITNIQGHPWRFLSLAIKLRCKILFNEAFIYAIAEAVGGREHLARDRRRDNKLQALVRTHMESIKLTLNEFLIDIFHFMDSSGLARVIKAAAHGRPFARSLSWTQSACAKLMIMRAVMKCYAQFDAFCMEEYALLRHKATFYRALRDCPLGPTVEDIRLMAPHLVRDDEVNTALSLHFQELAREEIHYHLDPLLEDRRLFPVDDDWSQRYFLCAGLEDGEYPWDEEETDW